MGYGNGFDDKLYLTFLGAAVGAAVGNQLKKPGMGAIIGGVGMNAAAMISQRGKIEGVVEAPQAIPVEIIPKPLKG